MSIQKSKILDISLKIGAASSLMNIVEGIVAIFAAMIFRLALILDYGAELQQESAKPFRCGA